MGKKNRNKATKGTKGKEEKKKEEDVSLEEFLEHWSSEEEEKGEGKWVQEEEEEESSGGEEEETNKEYLATLEEKDPEFHKFLQENDQQLLEFDDDDDDDDERGSGAHNLPEGELEVASDESDFELDEDDDEEQGKGQKRTSASKVSSKKIEEWEKKIEESPNVEVLESLSKSLKSAISSLSEDKSGVSGAAFNALVRLCITRMEPAIRKVLKVDEKADGKKMQKSKKWAPANRMLKLYTMSLVNLLGVSTEPSAVGAVLKHVHSMLPFFSALPKSSKHLVQLLVLRWSTEETDSVRILSFLCLMRLTRSTPGLFGSVVKQMYMAYVKNSKFTSPSTWPKINFMRRSLAELFALDQKAAYNHAFVYIRQLSIALRNAITLQVCTYIRNLLISFIID